MSRVRPSRRAVLSAGGAASAGASLWGAHALGRSAAGKADGGGRQGKNITVGYLPITDSAPLLVAHARGLYDKHGVRVSPPLLFRSWSSLTEAFLAGTVDVIHLLMPMAVHLKYSLGATGKVVAWNHVNGSALTVAPGIAETRQLAGTAVAVPAWFSVHNILLQKILRQAGLTPVIRKRPDPSAGEVALTVMAPADMIPALAQGTIAGFTVADPFNAAAHLLGRGRVHRFMGDVWRDHACCVTMMDSSLINTRHGEAQGFVNALVEAQVFARENRQETAALLSRGYLPQEPRAVARALTDHLDDHRTIVRHPDWGGQLLQFQPYPYPSYTQQLVENMRGTLVDAPSTAIEGLDPATVHTELVHDPLVISAINAIGGISIFGEKGLTREEKIDSSPGREYV